MTDRITDEKDYLNRRSFLKRAGIVVGSVAVTGAVYRALNPVRRGKSALELRQPELANFIPTTQQSAAATTQAFRVDEPQTSFEDITHYNNFYEFSTDKEGVAPAAEGFVARPWTVQVAGLCAKPKTFDLDEILAISAPEERVYRMRCVEAWSMVIPWAGFSLSKLLEKVEPLSSAKYVAFTTLKDPKRFPNQRSRVLNWPYIEGLRMDEAMHPLTLLASGLYGRALPAQNGAPLRMVIPWKYGFKGIKSIVKFDLTDRQPRTTWSDYGPDEYGFYANVNPQVDHPRWSQATERRIGPDGGRRKTLMFNGYAEQVGSLYAGMDSARELLMKDPQFAKSVVFVNAIVPLAILCWDAYAHQLGANPTETAIHVTGMLALIFLLLSLTVTPLRKITGNNQLSHFRRMLGLFAFFYGCIHLFTYLDFDRGFSLQGTIDDVLSKKFIFFGMLALLLMAPLAATSTNGAIKRLGSARWKRLHQLAYVAAILGAIHFWMSKKADKSLPWVIAIALAVLLGYRLLKKFTGPSAAPTAVARR